MIIEQNTGAGILTGKKNIDVARKVLSAEHEKWLSISLLGENMSMAATAKAAKKRIELTNESTCGLVITDPQSTMPAKGLKND